MPYSPTELALIADYNLNDLLPFLVQKCDNIFTVEELEAWIANGNLEDYAFWVSRLSEVEMVEEVYTGLVEMATMGGTIQEFIEMMDEIFLTNGWDELAPYHLENIYRTNLMGAYNSAHYEQQIQQADLFPYWLLDVTLDARTSDFCRPLAKPPFVRWAHDPIWQRFYPPLHYNCRDNVVALKESDLARLGLKINEALPTRWDEDSQSYVVVEPMKGFGGPQSFMNSEALQERIASIKGYLNA